jgi:hypothetical protein
MKSPTEGTPEQMHGGNISVLRDAAISAVTNATEKKLRARGYYVSVSEQCCALIQAATLQFLKHRYLKLGVPPSDVDINSFAEFTAGQIRVCVEAMAKAMAETPPGDGK